MHVRYIYITDQLNELIWLKKLTLLREIYKERGATEQEWQELEKAVREFASHAFTVEGHDAEAKGTALVNRDPNVCARCERADLAEQRRREE